VIVQDKNKNKWDHVRFNYKIWMSTEEGEGILGDGKWQILKAIEEHGSLMTATEAMGLTYRRTWGNLKKIEKILGIRIIEKTRGGTGGGKTRLTEDGRRLVTAFDRFHQKYDGLINDAFEEFKKDLEGEDEQD